MRVNEIIKGVSDNRKEQPKSELEPLVTLKFRSQRTKEEPAKKLPKPARGIMGNSRQMKKTFPEIRSIDSWIPLQIKRTRISVGSCMKFEVLKASQIFLKH